VKSGAGALTLTGASTYTGKTEVRDGILLVNGVLGNTGVTVNGGTLSGDGVIAGPVTIEKGGTLALGISHGVLTISNDLALSAASRTRVEIAGALGTSGRALCLGRATYDGLLLVNNLAPASPLTNGQSFHLFDAALGRGGFRQISPGPGPGLVWSFEATSGILRAVAPPMLQVASVTRNTMSISWAGSQFRLQAQTNSAGLSVSANWFDYPGGATSPVVVPISPARGSMFLRLVTP
jgi:autotransporter-associated beta strand protein